jgi:hypothetical protein
LGDVAGGLVPFMVGVLVVALAAGLMGSDADAQGACTDCFGITCNGTCVWTGHCYQNPLCEGSGESGYREDMWKNDYFEGCKNCGWYRCCD